MASPPNITQIIAPRVAFVDPRTGLISREWYRFLLNLLTRLDPIPDNVEDLEKAPDANSAVADLSALLAALKQEVETLPSQQADPLAAAVAAALGSLPPSATVEQIAGLQAQIDGLLAAPASGGSGLALPLPIIQGGTGQITAPLAINALLPDQSGNSGEFLTTDGSVASWGTPSNGITTGTWTPVFMFGGSSTGFTYSRQYGVYTKFSNGLVLFQLIVSSTAKGSGTGTWQVSLPFTVAEYSTTLITSSGFNFTNTLILRAEVGSARGFLYTPVSPSSGTSYTDADYTGNSYVETGGVFMT